jgi:elongator complex protein 1
MRNLRNIKHVTFSPPPDRPLSNCAWDVDSNSVIFASGPSEQSNHIELRRCPIEKEKGATCLRPSLIASWDAPCPLPDLACDHVIDIQYFPDTSSICLVLAGGDILQVREQPLVHGDRIEIVGSVEVGIAAAAWSPDEEVLAICTNGNTLLLMTRDFDNVASVDILAEDLNASKHVSVGWGKSETQFRGKGAKALRDPTMPEKVDEGLLSSKDDQDITISWRGDGQFVAVNGLQASHRRVLRIYTREGVLNSVTEPVDFLEGALSWRPAGNLLAGVQRHEKEAKVVFFELNGLRHGDFSLRLSEEELQSWASSIKLCWNADSSILAVVFSDRVQVWTTSNYHYYLKSEILLPNSSDASKPCLRWHPERPFLLAIGVSGSQGMLRFRRAVQCSSAYS